MLKIDDKVRYLGGDDACFVKVGAEGVVVSNERHFPGEDIYLADVRFANTSITVGSGEPTGFTTQLIDTTCLGLIDS